MLTNEETQALLAYAARNGRNWKARLNAAWNKGFDAREPEGSTLRQIRNQFGPSWLAKYKP